MYYKLLNKTILSSAFVTLICLSGSEAFAQELFTNEEKVSVAVEAPDDISFEIEDDIIPLSEEEFLIPEVQQQDTASKEQTAEVNGKGAVKDEQSIASNEQPADQKEKTPENKEKADVKEAEPVQTQPKSESTDKSVKTDDVKAPTKTTGSNKDVQETIKAPEENLEDEFIADFEIDFNEDPEAEPEDLFEQSPEATEPEAEKSANNASTNKISGIKNIKKDALNKAQTPGGLKFGDAILVQTNNDLFNQMSDIEKQTTLLSLELKRERIRNEVEAAKAVREKAELEKQAQAEAKKRQEAEWKNQQQINLVNAQEALKQREIELEKVKQHKALTAYMNSMLEQKQLWIAENSKLYDEIRSLKSTNASLRASYKSDLSNVETQSEKLLKSAETARTNYERAIASLTAQNAQLRKRIESMEQAAKKNPNPFADKSGNQISTSADALIKPVNIAKEYAIMEITGQGGELFVKLINKEGDSFVAKAGTVLNTGHMIEEITPNYVQFDRNGLKDFLYTAASALTMEPKKMSDEDTATPVATPVRSRAALISDDGLPSVSNSMFVK